MLDSDRTSQRFYDLIWPHRADVLRVAQFLTRHPFEADDLAQETFLKALRRVDSLPPAREGEAGAGSNPGLKPWLLTILRNTWLDRLRSASARREVSLGEKTADPVVPAPDGAVEWDNPEEVLNAFSDRQVIDALKDLPEDIRWTLLLVDVEGLGQQEAADVLGVPTGTIKSRAHRGRAMLRKALEPLARDRGWTGARAGATRLASGGGSEIVTGHSQEEP